MTREEFAASTALIIANTKRLARGLPVLTRTEESALAYRLSEAWRAARRRAQVKFAATEKGKAVAARALAKRKASGKEAAYRATPKARLKRRLAYQRTVKALIEKLGRQPTREELRQPKAVLGLRKHGREYFVPPRAPEPAIEPVFKPTPPRPVRAVVSETPPAPPIVAIGTVKGSCKAKCATTGWPCLLPAHGDTAHRHRRGAFVLVAAPAQKHFGEREVDRYAFASVAVSDEFSGTQLKRFERRGKRKSLAHQGVATTEGG